MGFVFRFLLMSMLATGLLACAPDQRKKHNVLFTAGFFIGTGIIFLC